MFLLLSAKYQHKRKEKKRKNKTKQHLKKLFTTIWDQTYFRCATYVQVYVTYMLHQLYIKDGHTHRDITYKFVVILVF